MKNINYYTYTCPYCGGSGEGRYDGSVCLHCHGLGTYTDFSGDLEDDEEEEDEEFLAD